MKRVITVLPIVSGLFLSGCRNENAYKNAYNATKEDIVNEGYWAGTWDYVWDHAPLLVFLAFCIPAIWFIGEVWLKPASEYWAAVRDMKQARKSALGLLTIDETSYKLRGLRSYQKWRLNWLHLGNALNEIKHEDLKKTRF